MAFRYMQLMQIFQAAFRKAPGCLISMSVACPSPLRLQSSQSAPVPEMYSGMHNIYNTRAERVEWALGGSPRGGDLFGEARRYGTVRADLPDMARFRKLITGILNASNIQ